MDVDVALSMGPGVLRLEHKHIVELFGPLGPKLEHGAHGGIAVDVGVFPLQIRLPGGSKGDVLVNLHQPRVHLPGLATLVPVQDVGLSGLDISVIHQHPLHQVLDVLHIRLPVSLQLQDRDHLVGQLVSGLSIARLVGGVKGLADRACNLLLVKGRHPSVPLADAGHGHREHPPLCHRKNALCKGVIVVLK